MAKTKKFLDTAISKETTTAAVGQNNSVLLGDTVLCDNPFHTTLFMYKMDIKLDKLLFQHINEHSLILIMESLEQWSPGPASPSVTFLHDCLLLLLRIGSAHLRKCLQTQRYVCMAYDEVQKADLSKGCWNPKRKLGVTLPLSEIIELKFGKKMLYIILNFKCGYRRTIFFWIPGHPC